MSSFVFSLLVNNQYFPKANTSGLGNILNILFAALGALAFLMVVIGGLRYILSGGEADKVAESKRMIVHAIAGLVLISLAAVIVDFILGQL